VDGVVERGLHNALDGFGRAGGGVQVNVHDRRVTSTDCLICVAEAEDRRLSRTDPSGSGSRHCSLRDACECQGHLDKNATVP
jgi:hypothetical protein